jgi:hypothetical protein
MHDLTWAEMADALWPEIGQGVLASIIAVATDGDYENMTVWLNDHYQAKIIHNATPPKLGEFIRTFCRNGIQGNVKVNLGSTRRGVGGDNRLINSVFSFEANGLDNMLAMLTMLSTLFEASAFVASGDERARRELAETERRNRDKEDRDSGRNFGKSGTKKVTGE